MKNDKPKLKYVIPFFLVLAVLTVCCFVPSLHPDKSMSERRELAAFPEFSWESLASGEYFQGISTWFSDTFPGREGWLETATMLSELHGEADLMISGAVPTSETVPDIFDDSEPLPVFVSNITLAPTEAPTEPATEAPTQIPTQASTEEPAEDVSTPAQAAAPTAVPTEAPTHAPTEAAIEETTQSPTEIALLAQPTDAPTVAVQTEQPTQAGEAQPEITEPEESQPEETPAAETGPEETQWQGANAGEGAEIIRNLTTFQLGDAAYVYQNFSKQTTDDYAAVLNALVQALDGTGITVVSAPPPTAVGIMFEEQYQESLNSVSQRKILDYLESRLDDRIVKVDTVSALLAHNNEYLFFRTDHHWTALGAYYSYRATCEALGMTPVELSDMEEWNLGEFRGSLTGRVSRPNKLRSDELIAYRPAGELSRWVIENNGWKYERPFFNYWEGMDILSKYAVFGGDNPMVMVCNASLEDAPTCVILRDSFANCFVPFLTQNFSTIYTFDYRTYNGTPVLQQLEELKPDYIILMPYITAIEDLMGPEYFSRVLFGQLAG